MNDNMIYLNEMKFITLSKEAPILLKSATIVQEPPTEYQQIGNDQKKLWRDVCGGSKAASCNFSWKP